MSTTQGGHGARMRSIERAMARNLEDYAAALGAEAGHDDVATVRVAGGVAASTGPGSLLTTVKGVRDLGSDDLDVIEAFFRDHGEATSTIELAPWPDQAAARLLAGRGYRIAGQEDVVVTTAPAAAPSTTTDRPRAEIVPIDAWPDIVRAAYDLEDASPVWTLVAASAHLTGIRLWGVRDDGRWVAGAQSVPYDDVVIFGNDGTHPDHRRRGAQRALIADRLAAVPAGTIVAAEVAPGSQSERNYLRSGFAIAYARDVHVRALP